MAIFADTDSVVTVNSVDLSDHLLSSNFNQEADTVETVAMGGTWVATKPTFKRGSVSLEFQQDFAAGSVHATLNPLLGTSTTLTYKPTSAATGTTNPLQTVTVVVTEVPVSDASAGEISTISVTWPFDGAVVETDTP